MLLLGLGGLVYGLLVGLGGLLGGLLGGITIPVVGGTGGAGAGAGTGTAALITAGHHILASAHLLPHIIH